MKLTSMYVKSIPLILGMAALSANALADFSVTVSAGYNGGFSGYQSGYIVQQPKVKVLNPSYYRANSPQANVYNLNRPTIIIIQPDYRNYPYVQPTGNYCYRISDNRVRAPGWNNACSGR